MRSPSMLINGIVLCTLSTGCSLQPAVSAAEPATTHASAFRSPTAAAVAKKSDYRTAIVTAIKERRLYSPEGSNAFELYLAWHAADPDDTAIKIALLELEPYLVVASEQSLHRGDIPEARRLIELIAAADVQASAVPRLREQVALQDKMRPVHTESRTENNPVDEANALATQ